MNIKTKYFNFLAKLEQAGANKIVLEALSQGFKDIFEGKVGPSKRSFEDDPDYGFGMGELEEDDMEDGISEEEQLRDDIGTNMRIVDNYQDAGFKMPEHSEPSPEEAAITNLCNALNTNANSAYPTELVDIYRYIAAESFKYIMMRNDLSDEDKDIIADVNPDDIINSIASRLIRTGFVKIVKIPIHFNTGNTVTFPALKIPIQSKTETVDSYFYYNSKNFNMLKRMLSRANNAGVVQSSDVEFILNEMIPITPQYFRDWSIFDKVALDAVKSIVKRNYKKLSTADLEWNIDPEESDVDPHDGGEAAYTDFAKHLEDDSENIYEDD